MIRYLVSCSQIEISELKTKYITKISYIFHKLQTKRIMINEEYIRSVISQIKNGINEDQALYIIKELIKNRGEEPKSQITNIEKKHLYWDFNNANTTSQSQNWVETVTILDMESIGEH